MTRIAYNDLQRTLGRALERVGFDPERARDCAAVFAGASLDGIDSHGILRFPRFVRAVADGLVDPGACPACVGRLGALEQWDGRFGAGPLNAAHATTRAAGLAREYGVGCVALRHTNHWMRAGAYGWQAARAGVAFMAWTNAKPNMPPWGAAEPRIGNNPLVVAAPRAAGPLVLDMAMSQYSYGKLRVLRQRTETLSVPGGYDDAGRLSLDPSAILETGRVLPIGHWKGAGLALMLDVLAAGLSGGRSTRALGRQANPDHGISQVFVAWDLARCRDPNEWARELDRIVDDLQTASPLSPPQEILYPGHRALRCREENLRHGIPVDDAVWETVVGLAGEG